MSLAEVRNALATGQTPQLGGGTAQAERMKSFEVWLDGINRQRQGIIGRISAAQQYGPAHANIVANQQQRLAALDRNIETRRAIALGREPRGTGTRVLNLTINQNSPSFESQNTIAEIVRNIHEAGGFDDLDED